MYVIYHNPDLKKAYKINDIGVHLHFQAVFPVKKTL